MKKFVALLLGIGFLSLTACNTVEGVGQDVKATGRGIEKAANEAKPK